MKGTKDLSERMKTLLDAERSASLSDVAILDLRLQFLECTVYYALQRLRDEIVYDRRSENKLDMDLASVQGFVRSLMESRVVGYDKAGEAEASQG